MSRKVVTPVLRYLNSDLLGLIMGADAATVSSLMLTCKTLLKLVKSHYSSRHRRLEDTHISLRFTQCMLRDTFSSMTTGSMLFQARKSFGKTISGFSCAGRCAMVLVPSNVLKVWLAEADNLGWYNSDPNKSRVISLKGAKKHIDYVKSVLAQGSTIQHTNDVILLCTDLQVDKGLNFMSKVVTDSPKVLIVDEAHVSRNAVHLVQSVCKWYVSTGIFDKQLLLSADVMKPGRIGVSMPYRCVSVKDLGEVPKVNWSILPMRQLGDKWLDTLDLALSEYNKVVLVSIVDDLDYIQYFDDIQALDPNAPADPKRKRKKNREYRGAKIFYQKTGTKTIPKFNDYDGDCILLVNTNQNTGVNILADALVMPDAGSTNSIRITQTVGRVVRTTNNVDSVEIYLCAETEQAFIRCHYARCYYNEDWKYPFETLPTLPYLRKCISILKMLGTSITDVNSVDGCVIFADSSMILNHQEVIDWWITHQTDDTVLTEDMVGDLMCM